MSGVEVLKKVGDGSVYTGIVKYRRLKNGIYIYKVGKASRDQTKAQR